MAQEFEGITKAFESFERSFLEGRYYDAHEDLEPLWYPSRFDNKDEVRLWKGFINAAVSFELMRRGRINPSEVAWQTYLKYHPILETLVTPHKELYVKIDALIQSRRIQCQNS